MCKLLAPGTQGIAQRGTGSDQPLRQRTCPQLLGVVARDLRLGVALNLRHSASDWIMLLSLTVMWGSAFLMTKVAVESLPSSLVVAGRMAVASAVLWMLHGVRFSDLGPFRAIRWWALDALDMRDTDFGWTVEMQVKAAKLGYRVRDVPVRYRRRIGRSKISGTVLGSVRAGHKILWTIARERWLT